MTSIFTAGELARGFGLDANVFRDLAFIAFLRENRERVKLYLPSIVVLEIGYYFTSKGLSWSGYLQEVSKIGVSCLPWDSIDGEKAVARAVENRGRFPFRDHFRDYLIGTQCDVLGLPLVTFNTTHFSWCESEIMTPLEYTARFPV